MYLPLFLLTSLAVSLSTFLGTFAIKCVKFILWRNVKICVRFLCVINVSVFILKPRKEVPRVVLMKALEASTHLPTLVFPSKPL